MKQFPVMLLDENTSTPSGGISPPSSSPPGGGGPPGDASTPVSPIPDSPEEPSSGDHDALAGMEDSDFDLVELPSETPQVGETGGAPAQPTPPATPAQPATAPAGAPQTAPAPQAAPVGDAPQAPRSPLEQAIEGFRTNHEQLSNWASTNLFALSQQESELLETNAAQLIPTLMGKVYSQALQATTNLIKNFVPNMINEGVATTTARSAKAQEALNEFYASNPHLNAQQHGAAVDKWARAFRAANPGASRADAIKFVGNAVSAELGVTPHAAAPARRAAPFAPARPGTRVQAPTPQHDPYEGMDMEYDQQ